MNRSVSAISVEHREGVDSDLLLDGKMQGGFQRLFSNRDLFKLFLPLLIEQGLEYTVGLAASMMVAFVGESAVSGVSLVDFVMALIISVFAALATGASVIAGQYLGRHDVGNSRKAANQLVRFSALISLVIMVIIYLVKPLILNGLFGQITYEVRAAADIYLTIVALSIPFIALYSAGAAIFRTMGDSKLPMKIMIAMNVLNVAGNALLVLGFHMGVEGVAIPHSGFQSGCGGYRARAIDESTPCLVSGT